MTHVQPNAVPDDTGTSDEEVLHSYSALSVYAHAYSCLSIQPCPFQEPLPVTSGGQLQTETRTSIVLMHNQSHTYVHTYIHTYTCTQ